MKYLEDIGISGSMILKWMHVKELRWAEGGGPDSCGLE
jgi:hypothetical protein